MSFFRTRYQTIEFGEMDIHVCTLRDNQQFSDTDGIAAQLGISSASWPHFGILWPSSLVLAKYVLNYDVRGKRILEVGCGIALASLVLNHLHADITATDYHPEVEGFLQKNTQLNGDFAIPFIRTGWADAISDLGVFDLIIGSDLLYEADHVDLLSVFIERHAKDCCDVIVVDPGRGHHARFSKRMITLGYCHHQHKPVAELSGASFSGQILSYSRELKPGKQNPVGV